VLGGEVVEGQQHVEVVGDLGDGLGPLRAAMAANVFAAVIARVFFLVAARSYAKPDSIVQFENTAASCGNAHNSYCTPPFQGTYTFASDAPWLG
jgi:hypothetical protein